MTPRNSVGFIALEQSKETVARIVAATDSDLHFAAVYLGDAEGTCHRVLAGHSSTFESVTSGACFLTTDIASSASIEGSGSVIVAADGESIVYNATNPLPPNGIFAQPFSIVIVAAGGDDITVNFSGGDSAMMFDAVDGETPPGIVGKGKRFAFVSVPGDWLSFSKFGDDGLRLLLIVGLTGAGVMIVAACALVYWLGILRKTEESDEESSSAPLYDERPERTSDEPGGEGERNVGTTESRDEMEYQSPYETL
jgi:hypothetical protein